MLKRPNRLSPLYWFIISVICLPLIMGMLGVILPSLGIDPALGKNQLSFAAWRQLWQQQEYWSGLKLSVTTGLIATLLAYWFASSLIITCYEKPWFARLQSAVTPILSIPHAAVTIGVLFLLAPSGWLVRLISPWLTGFDRPPNWLTVQDPEGVALIITLVIKEMPYLIFAMAAALIQLQPEHTVRVARLMGYNRTTAWLYLIMPKLFPLVRLPLFMVLAFNLTVVDVASIIGPNTPSTLAVTLLRWFNDPSLLLRGQASAAALILACTVAVLIITWQGLYLGYEQVRKQLSLRGKRCSKLNVLTYTGAWLGGLIFIATWLALLMLPIWSFARRWRFPDTFPSQWSIDTFSRYSDQVFDLGIQSLYLGVTSTLFTLLITLCLLEYERRTGAFKLTTTLLFIVVLIPQVTLLFGVQVGLLIINMNGSFLSVLALHCFYVLPYVYLTLKAPYLAYDQAYLDEANRLRVTPVRNYFVIKIAMLKAPIATALAIGFSVSMTLYLPTLLAGEGRINTLTTEAVANASSGNRKLVSVLALIQALLPLLCFYLAIQIPKHWTRWRIAVRRRFC